MMMQRLVLPAAMAAILGLACASGAHANQAAPAAKDVVLATLAPAAQAAPGANQAKPDAMVVSVLVEGPYGMLTPRSTEAAFATGERFRIKLLAPRDGEVLIYNTNPLNQTSQTPIWKTQVKAGVESVSDLMQLTGNRGEDQLHVVLQPRTPPANAWAWFQNLFASKDAGAGGTSKDIRLVTESTPQSTYFYNPNGQGGYVPIRIRHQ
jgi:hypothetical protein